MKRNYKTAARQCVEELEARWLLSSVAKNHVHQAAITAKTTYVVDSRLHRGVVKPDQFSSPVGYIPSQIRGAYGINQIQFGAITGDGTGQTIAIIDAYDDPNIASDLAAFDKQFSLPGTNVSQVNTFFSKVNQTGQSSPLPAAGNGWTLEESLDVEWAHAIAPGANIVLVEANSNSLSDLISAVDWASSSLGVSVVSMSWSTGGDFPGETSYDSNFTTPAGHNGVTFVASTGDSGQPAGYPAVSPNVVAAGGTTLSISGSTYAGESAWSGSGGSVSTYEPQPAFQNNVVTQNQTYRTAPDISFDANPGTGVAVYDSYDFGSSAPWAEVGGTSVSAPCLSAEIAIADQGRAINGFTSLDGATQTLPRIYNLPASDFNDITSGNNGFAAGPGYDMTTGLGSPIANLFVQGLTQNPAGPYVATSSPLSTVAGPVSTISFTFSQAMDPTSFSVATGIDSFTGPGNANLLSQVTGYSWSNSNQTLNLTFNSVSASGTYTMVIGPDVKSASGENEMDQNFDGVAGEASDTYTAHFYITLSVGPDSYGYSATPYPYENLSLTPGASGVTSILSDTDDSSAAVSLGSNTFNFYGTTYTGGTSLYADTNGFLTLGSSPSGAEANNDDLSSDPSPATIAPLWDDWDTEVSPSTQQVLYSYRDYTSGGVPQELVIEWDQLSNNGALYDGYETTATFEAILQINTGSTPGTIVFNYNNLNLDDSLYSNGASATVGIKNSGTQGPGAQTLLVSLDNPSNPLVASGEAIRIGTTAAPSVAGEYTFYGGSSFDGNTAAPNANDNNAIATDKTALLPGQKATFANYTSYTRGINGITLDLADGMPTTLSLSDFTFEVGNSSNLSTWTTAPTPTNLVVTPGGGVNGSERVEFVWANNAIQNQWLQITVLSNSDTGLAAPFTFYFGNAIGSTGASASSARVTTADVTRTQGAVVPGTVSITNNFDFNRDGRVNTADVTICQSWVLPSSLQLITPPVPSNVQLLAQAGATPAAETVSPSSSSASSSIAPPKTSLPISTAQPPTPKPAPVNLGPVASLAQFSFQPIATSWLTGEDSQSNLFT